jgi:hypothetical protein
MMEIWLCGNETFLVRTVPTFFERLACKRNSDGNCFYSCNNYLHLSFHLLSIQKSLNAFVNISFSYYLSEGQKQTLLSSISHLTLHYSGDTLLFEIAFNGMDLDKAELLNDISDSIEENRPTSLR